MAVLGLYYDFLPQREQTVNNVKGAILKQIRAKTFGSDGDVENSSCFATPSLHLESPQTRIFLTGRPHIKEDIQGYFPNAVVMPISPSMDDIRSYLEMRLDRDPEPEAMSNDLRADIRDFAERLWMFLLVSLNIDAILGEVTIRQRWKKLGEMTQDNALGDAYTATVGRLKAQKGNKLVLGVKVLMWVLYSERTLRTEDLHHALGVEIGSADLDPENIPALGEIKTSGCPIALGIKIRCWFLRNGETPLGIQKQELDLVDIGFICEKIEQAGKVVDDVVAKETTIHRRRGKLSSITHGLGLGDAYRTTLGEIKRQGGEKARFGTAALMWISYAERPLKIDELCHALAVEIGAPNPNTDNIPSITTPLACCQGLAVAEKEASTVRLIHFTLQEYLRAQPDLFSPAHSTIAEICSTYLNSLQVKAFSTSPSPDHQHALFLEYSSLYRGVHAKRNLSDRAKLLALKLFDDHNNQTLTEILL
ncbi:hypothetical protein B9Z19DRAFT_1131165 [Tuber borchii]|uniref:GPI inositol-deacylase winged helix domain-containing protein n=1 Tax=Tuber borchii TaxID=42251 RepID=A0A2T6ZJ35_TUBBO|nr:hypothetical protein B9Z19DRAFT_1131165 [Tuber borchii]